MATIAKLLTPQKAYAKPDRNSRVVKHLKLSTPITESPTRLLVINREGDWLRVRLPDRPNGRTGWILADRCQLEKTDWRVEIDLSSRQTVVYHDGKVRRRFACVIGKPSTPTPTGYFFITEKALQPKGSLIGPWALCLNGYSNVLKQFGGGPGQIALHGQQGRLKAPMRSASSFGCIRYSTEATNWLAAKLPEGTPVRIKR